MSTFTTIGANALLIAIMCGIVMARVFPVSASRVCRDHGVSLWLLMLMREALSETAARTGMMLEWFFAMRVRTL